MNKLKIVLLMLFLLVLTACRPQSFSPVSRTEIALDTVNTISIYDSQTDPEPLLDQAFSYLFEMEDLLSLYEQGSDIDRINQAAGQSPVKVSQETIDLVLAGLDYGHLTAEAVLDITIGPLSTLWKDHFESDSIPNPKEVEKAQATLNLEGVQVQPESQQVGLEKADMVLDLGALAKGYLADQLAVRLEEAGVEAAVINLGGNVKLVGHHPNPADSWEVGIQNPFEVSGDLIATVHLDQGSIVTSGIYQRYVEKNGEIYHHIIDPQTGYPVQNELAAVTIMTEESLKADALSTLVFGLGLEKGMQLINQVDGTEAIFIDRENGVHTSQGLDQLELLDPDYKLVQ